MERFDLVVVGAGHAGAEAAWAAARLGRTVALVTFRLAHVGRLSCNPAIGGQAKGHLVREIDALGGLMGRAADAACLQFRRLNTRKGLAVQSSRAQVDIDLYPRWVRSQLERQDRITLIEGEVGGLTTEGGCVTGVRLRDGTELRAAAVVLTTGTFLGGVLHRGDARERGGRVDDPASDSLPASLRELGLPLGRLKTGTVPRLDSHTIRWDQLEPQPDVDPNGRFSFGPPVERPGSIRCAQVYTTPAVHDLIRRNLHRSPLYSGAIVGRGPRYCPSVEDKVTKFPDRERHLLFLEPEGLSTERVYLAGFSTSLPPEVQEEAVRALTGLGGARVLQYGYAVEYDFHDPTALGPDLQHREVRGLYFAGQINGTSGYEEAAAQGLVAGLSAGMDAPFHVKRSEGYIGVLIDDLVSRGVGGEPYRMFTSRAEHRLLLREDNADLRLMPRARDLGLIDGPTWEAFERRSEQRARAADALAAPVHPTEGTLAWLEARHAGGLAAPTSAGALLGRPGVTWADLGRLVELPELDPEVAVQVEADAKYRGYLEAAARRADRSAPLEQLLLPDLDDPRLVASGLSREVRERLAHHRPQTVGQAARLPGITAAAVSLLVTLADRRTGE